MDSPPLIYGEYEVCQRPDGTPFVLGEGTSGTTYKAVRRELVFGRTIERPAAVKVFKAGRVESERQKNHFVRELSVLSQIQHPNVVAYLKQGEEKGEIYYVMEFCGGGTLEDFCQKSGGLTPAQLASVATQTLDGLAAVHASGFVHCDLKPSNLLLHQGSGGTDLMVKLSDFGSVQQIAAAPDAGATHAEGVLSGEPFRGSPLFASPEQIKEHRLDHRSDIYSLGITLWFLALGRRPFEGAVGAVQSWHLSAPPHLIALPESFPNGFREVLAWMLAKNPAERPPDLASVKKKFAAFLNESSASLPVPDDATATSDDSINGLYDIAWTARVKRPLGNRCPATRRDTRESVDLLFLDENLPATDEMEAHWKAWVEACRRKDLPPGIIPVRSFHRIGNEMIVALGRAEGTPLSHILSENGGQLEVPETLGLLAGLAEDLDFLDARHLRGVSLSIDDLMVAEAAPAKTAAGKPERAWQVMIDPGVSLPAGLRPDELTSTDAGHTITSVSGGGDRDIPHAVSFLGLLYRLAVGHEISDAAYIDPAAYTPTQKLGDQTNALIREWLSSNTRPAPTCHSLLERVIENEGFSMAEIARSGKRIQDSMASVAARTRHPTEASRTVAPAHAAASASAAASTRNIEKTGGAAAHGLGSPPSPPSRSHATPAIPANKVAKGNHWLVPAAIGLVLLCALGGGGYLAWQKWGKAKPATSVAATKATPTQASSPSNSATNSTSTTPATPTTTPPPPTPPPQPPTPPTVAVPASFNLPEGTFPKQPTIKVNGKTARTSPLGNGFSIALDGAATFPVEIQFSAPGHEPRSITLNPGDKAASDEMIKLKRIEGKVVLSAPPESTDFTMANFKFIRPLEAERDHVPMISFSMDKSFVAGSNQADFVVPTGVYTVVLRSDHPERITPRIYNESLEITANSVSRVTFPPSASGKWQLKSNDGTTLEISIDKGLGGGSLDAPDGKSVATISSIRVPDAESVVVSLDAPDGPRELTLKLPGGKATGATYNMNPALAPLSADGEASRVPAAP